MEKFQECREQGLELIQTVDEGIGYISSKFDGGEFSDGYMLLHDVAQAIYSINKTLKLLSGVSNKTSVEIRAENIQNTLNVMLFKLQEEQQEKIVDFFNDQFVYEYGDWKLEALTLLEQSHLNH